MNFAHRRPWTYTHYLLSYRSLSIVFKYVTNRPFAAFWRSQRPFSIYSKILRHFPAQARQFSHSLCLFCTVDVGLKYQILTIYSLHFSLGLTKIVYGCVFINIYTINNNALSILSLQHKLVSVCRYVPCCTGLPNVAIRCNKFCTHYGLYNALDAT